MARKQRDTVEYFPHDARASESDTLKILQNKFGNDGYAFWFKLLERLASADGHIINCSSQVKVELLAAYTQTTVEMAISIVDILASVDAIDVGLWQSSRLIWCQHFVDNVSDVYKNRRRPIPQKPITTGNNGISTEKKGISTPDNPQSKVKESKVNNIYTPDKKKYGEFINVLLTDEEHSKLITKFGEPGTKALIEQLSQGIESKDYKYKSHYATILTWSRKEGHKQQVTAKVGKDGWAV